MITSGRLGRVLGLALLAALVIGGVPWRSLPTASAAGLAVTGLSAAVSSLPEYGKFELTFGIANTVAKNLQLPYDPAPPPGLAGGIGISVEGLFLPPGQTDWSQALHQPGFLYQAYQRQQVGSNEWLYPQGTPVWKVRFAPAAQGVWQYLVRAQDASVCAAGANPCTAWVQSSTGSFTVGAPLSGQHGFLHVSKNDPRYFEFSDGTPFVGLGYNFGASMTNFTYDMDSQLKTDSANGISLLRTWMSGSDIAGSAWDPWQWFGGPGYGGYLPDPGLAVAPAGSGHDYTYNLDQSANRVCLFDGFSQGAIAVKPSTTYQLTVTAEASNITGPANSGNPNYGFTVKQSGWPSSCPGSLDAVPSLIPYLQNSGWTTLQGSLTTTSSEYFLPDLFMALDNTTGGQANVSQISLREQLADGTLGPELLMKSQSDVDMDFNQLRSWDWDYAIDDAAQNNVFLKLTVLEKNDRVWNDINPDGSMTSSGGNNNFYASPNTKVRRLHEYYWRYLAARWGYATSVHSWELMNEGDPYNGYHYEMANTFAKEMHQLDPNRHMATTSTWATFPASQFWGNSAYPDIDYADLHAYVSTGLGSYEWSAPSGMTVDTNPADTYNASQGALQITAGVTSGNTTVWVRGLGTWTISALVRAQNLNGSCPYGAPSSMAGPQIIATLDNSTTIAIPADPANPTQFWICTAPAGTYNYTPVSGTLVLHDTNWHQFVLFFKTSYATSGTAWYDNLSIQSPDGRTARLMGNGTFDDRLRMDYDTAWFTTVFSLLDGANSVGGAGKPVIRGETGIDYSGGPQQELPQLANDTHGVWLHNLEWGTLNPGGMYDLYWWLDDIQKNNLYFQYKSVHDFLTGISLNNGRYQDAQAQVSAGNVRALGQKDLLDGQAHVWIQNTNHTWYNVVNGVSWGTLSGTVTLSGFAAKQTYSLTWWQFDDPGNLTTQQTSLTSDASGNLVLNLATLPTTITDAAVKISGPGTILPYTEQLTPIVK